ncbi:type II toxin-antitoxin system Phd/YefM family antitoxin [Microbacterium sp. X-17]|uniref:type II toxin-antitoxin system Phd/YefM family antitoxin n=1 Tax=Microbacterium sp. X-17 TaxID=3144404 RepID=UPI0031F4F367
MTKTTSESAAFTVHEAKTHLSRILRMVENGEEVRILRGTHPVARVVPIVEEPRRRRLGTLKGQIWMSDDFNDIDEDIVDAFENSELFPPEAQQ